MYSEVASGIKNTFVRQRRAADSRQHEELELLREIDTTGREGTCSSAARWGHLETAQWVLANNYEWCEYVFYDMDCEYYKMMQWLRANGCSWRTNTFWIAVLGSKDNLEWLKWLHANGCPWDEETSE